VSTHTIPPRVHEPSYYDDLVMIENIVQLKSPNRFGFHLGDYG
jgi:hypothetical protein